MRGFWKILVGSFFLLPLFACGGGGGGGGGAPAAVTNLVGTVSDSTQQPVAGATVTVVDGTSGATVQTATTDAAGRYRAVNLPKGTPLTVVSSGPEGTFPSQIEGAVITSGVVTVLDFYLPSTGPATEAPAGIWKSQATLSGSRSSILDLSAATLSATPASVYVAPFDVSAMGNGFPTYSVSPLAVGPAEIAELFAAAAFNVLSGGGVVTFDAADLYLPVPLSLSAAAIAADTAGTTILFRFDETTAGWVEEAVAPVLTLDPVDNQQAFLATVSRAGLYRVGGATPSEEVVGTVTYLGGTTPAAGITLFVTGGDYGYQQVVTTDASGNYTARTKVGGATLMECVAWGYGVQLSHQATVTVAAPDVTLPFAVPVPGVPAAATLVLDDQEISAPLNIGLIAASGRFSADPVVIDGAFLTPGRADISILLDFLDGLLLTPTTSGAGIQEIPGSTFESLNTAPTSGYLTGFVSVPLAGAAATPILIAVNTGAGHYAKISVDKVTDLGGGLWQVELRSAFSLTGSF